MNIKIEPNNTQNNFEFVLNLIQETQNNVYKTINTQIIDLYWNIGQYLYKQNTWGKSVVKELAIFIKTKHANTKGFSAQNLWRMKQFYSTYKDLPKLSTLLREVSWSHNIAILSCSTIEEKLFYLKLVKTEKLSFRELQRQMDSSVFERAMISNQKLSTVSRVLPQDITNVFKDTYVLEMLELPEPHSEKTLKEKIAKNISKFLLEFGRDFAFMGEEYPLQVGNQDFAIDLLFYHRKLQCLVAIELKIGKFKPEHLGQLNFYLEALDRDIKTKDENPSIGILLCKTKDETVVEYAMSRNVSPALVADYKVQLPKKQLLQQKWQTLLNNLNTNSSE